VQWLEPEREGALNDAVWLHFGLLGSLFYCLSILAVREGLF
jgi:hypothetical protein